MFEVLAFDENHTSLTKKSIRFLFLLCVFLTTKARMDGWMDDCLIAVAIDSIQI